MKRNLTVGHLERSITRAFSENKHRLVPRHISWVAILKRRLHRLGYEFHGPFGIRCAFTVNAIGRKRSVELEITNHDGWRIGRRNYKKVATHYPPNSIGALNKLQFQYVRIPKDTPLSQVLPPLPKRG